MKFSGTWRDYQERVLDEFDAHIVDERVHVVAAPGSGKTILGLELMRHLGRPTVVLAPTRTICDQCSARLVPLFMTEAPRQERLSPDLKAPATMTTATYQALHTIWADSARTRFGALISSLNAVCPIALILDEAHHLRREWWSALHALVDALPDTKLIALTATPPYDASFAEWARYEAMCGSIDLEIGIPELVRNGDLCPHQDHVLFSAPHDDALELISHRRNGLAQIQLELRADATLLDFFETHPWLTEPDAHVETILEAPELLSAIQVHLAASGRKPSSAALKLLGVRRSELPLPSAFWLEVFLNGILFRFAEVFPIGEERRKTLRLALHEHGLIEGGKVRLTESKRVFELMSGSLAKLASIETIARAETDSRGGALRIVILPDHVRAGELPRAARSEFKPAKLGVVPIFETLRRANIEGQSLAVLTGGLIILPNVLQTPLLELARARGIATSEFELSAIPGCPGHSRLLATGNGSRRSVELVTALLTEGHVTVLVGTQALLGEGWDAPAINSLILASNSGAFMLANQMRGRAIRVDPSKPDKVANIWPLATIEEIPSTPQDAVRDILNWGKLNDNDGIAHDLDLLNRRFRAFEGISNGSSCRIENGLGRLGLFGASAIGPCNANSLALARNRQAIAEKWKRSLGDAAERAHLREAPTPDMPRVA